MSAEQRLLDAVRQGDASGVAAALAAGPGDRAWAVGVNKAVHEACSCGRLRCLRVLLEHGADPNAEDSSQRPIHKAARAGHLPCVTALLAAGADPCATCSLDSVQNCTPLHAGAGNLEIARLLLEAAPQAATMLDSQSRMPLHLGTGRVKVVRLLLEAAPQTTTVRDSHNRTPLDVAIQAAHGESAQLLLAETELQPANEIITRLIRSLVRLDQAGRRDCLGRLAPAVPVLVARLDVSLDAGDGNYTFQRYRRQMVSSSLAKWLPAMLRHLKGAVARLVPFLPPSDRARLRTLALCLVRYQRSLPGRLPAPIVHDLLGRAGLRLMVRAESWTLHRPRTIRAIRARRLCSEYGRPSFPLLCAAWAGLLD